MNTRAATNPILEKGTNVVLAAFYGIFAWSYGTAFFETYSFSSLLFFVFESMLVLFFLFRAPPMRITGSYYDWIIAILGAYITLAFRPADEPNDMFALQVVQMAGILVSFFGLMALNRSFGIVAANRKVKTGGIYRFIRHPIYAGYFVSVPAFFVQNLNWYNLVVVVLFLVFSVLRILTEEKLLSMDPDYAEYMRITRWRMLPGIW